MDHVEAADVATFFLDVAHHDGDEIVAFSV